MLHRIIRSWYTGRWWVGCYIWYSYEGTGRGPSPLRPLLAVPNVTAYPSTASVPITVLLYNSTLLCSFNVGTKGLISVGKYLPGINFRREYPQAVMSWISLPRIMRQAAAASSWATWSTPEWCRPCVRSPCRWLSSMTVPSPSRRRSTGRTRAVSPAPRTGSSPAPGRQ